jgi:RNA polymerase sigma factor (TIGR02999 family)
MTDVTILLENWRQGDAGALERLTPLVYSELRRLAANRLRMERGGHTLQPTALIHEAYLRLVAQDKADAWQSRGQFFALASHLMRQILVDHARKRNAAKRGGEAAIVPLAEELAAGCVAPSRMEALDEALRELEKFDARKSKVMELKYFGGLDNQEVAAALQVSVPTVVRDCRMAEAWLYRYMTGD